RVAATKRTRPEAALHLRVEGGGVTLRTYRGVNSCKFGGGPNGIRTRVRVAITFSPSLLCSYRSAAPCNLDATKTCSCRVEDWRGLYEPVSSPRHIKRRERFSRTPLSCPLRITGYETYELGARSGKPQYRTR